MQKLYVNGCSLSNHTDVLTIEKNWPHILGNLLGYETVNDAIGMGSNQRIFRTLYDYVNSNDTQDTLFLIQLTYPFRYEHFYKGKWIKANSHNITELPEPLAKAYHKLRIQMHSDEEESYNLISQAVAIQHLLLSKGITNYYFLNAQLPIDLYAQNYLNNSVRWLFDDIQKSNLFVYNFDKVSKIDPHPNENGHQQIANWIYKRLQFLSNELIMN